MKTPLNISNNFQNIKYCRVFFCQDVKSNTLNEVIDTIIIISKARLSFSVKTQDTVTLIILQLKNLSKKFLIKSSCVFNENRHIQDARKQVNIFYKNII